MKFPGRVLAITVCGVGPLLLASACGSEATSTSDNLVSVQSTNYVTIEPATTTTTIATPDSVVDGGGGVSDAAQTYVIQAGDTLGGIATKHDISLKELTDYNQIEGDPSKYLIKRGDEIGIPPGSKVPGAATGGDTSTGGGTTGGESATEDSVEDSTDSTAGCSHTVVAGDNPSVLAKKYEVTLEQLNAANSGNAAYEFFRLGDQITIPPGGKCP